MRAEPTEGQRATKAHVARSAWQVKKAEDERTRVLSAFGKDYICRPN